MSDPALEVWRTNVRPKLDGYMGHLFERIVEQAWVRHAPERGLPLVQEWGRWEGADRSRQSLEMDIVTRLTTGGMLTGSIKWSARPVGLRLHRDHLRDLHRLADSGHRWAHEALGDEAILLYASAAGFTAGFLERAEEGGLRVICWSLQEMCGG